MPPPVEPPMSLLYHDPDPLPELDEEATVTDLVKRIHELTARYSETMVEHRGLSRFVVGEYLKYKEFYDEESTHDHR